MLGWAGNQGQGQGVQIQGSTDIELELPHNPGPVRAVGRRSRP